MIKDDEAFTEDNLEAVPGNNPKLFSTTLDFRGPSVMFTMGSKNSIALSSRVRGALQVSNISGNLAELLRTAGESDDLVNKINKDNQLSLNGNVQAELGLTYAREVFSSGSHYLKAGLTVKKLTGIYSSHFINRNADFRVEEQINDADPENSNVVVHVDQIDFQYGYLTDDLLENVDGASMMGWLFKGDAPGQGWGADIGFTYEYRPNQEKYQYTVNGQEHTDRQKEKYKYRFSFALMDLGKIRYDNPAYVKSFSLKRTNKEIHLRDFEEAENTEDYTRILDESLDITPADRKTSFQSGLPTALNLNFDYHLAGRFYVNAALVQNLQHKYAIAMHQPSLVALTPRLDTKGLTIALPLSYYNNYSVFAVGGMVKVGPYFIGSDNIGGAFNLGKPYGANVYTGFSFSLGQAKKKEKNVKAEKVKS